MRLPSTSRYRNDPVLQLGTTVYYGFRRHYDISPRVDDVFITVRPGDTPHAIAWRTLGDARYWWVIADYNDILDPFADLVAGAEVRVPSRVRLVTDILV